MFEKLKQILRDYGVIDVQPPRYLPPEDYVDGEAILSGKKTPAEILKQRAKPKAKKKPKAKVVKPKTKRKSK